MLKEISHPRYQSLLKIMVSLPENADLLDLKEPLRGDWI